MRGNRVGWAVLGLLVVALVVTGDPALVGVSTYQPFAQLIALRGWLALGLLALAGVLGGAALLVHHRGVDRPVRLTAAILALLAAAGVHGAVVIGRGVTAAAALPADKRAGDLDVLAFNTWGGAAGDARVSALIDDVRPDAVVLPETTAAAAHRIAAAAGPGFTVLMGEGRPGGSGPTALLISAGLGEYERIDGPDLEYGMVGARPLDGPGPVLYAVHVVSPVGERTAAWRRELALVTAICDRTDGAVVAGDFNATVDHAPLRATRCVDGSVRSGGVGTWPAGAPRLLGAPIDHVLADPARWSPVGSAVRDVGGSDHRALVVRLRRH
ncbi:endonuclease/exonuclease/phosphatase family protein [Cumulibacter manganitolerans]|uniref:endonuclease/exonuclease/phosphatase family protein n=1 Tax=Cumulibacter manganitolerans TaxID=1884992 RepID=UPI001885FC27|nr:endonuclease/exonuclease/phosphatase family protein [Cumulibacter manganitolerans]